MKNWHCNPLILDRFHKSFPTRVLSTKEDIPTITCQMTSDLNSMYIEKWCIH